MPENSIFERTLGKPSSSDPMEHMRVAYSTLTGQAFDTLELFDESDRLATAIENIVMGEVSDDLQIHERAWMFVSLMDVVLERRVVYANSLTDWPSYRQLMERYGKKGGHSALMIGASDPFSCRAFKALAEDEYGVDRAYVIDLKGSSNMKKHSIFSYGSGLAIPFRIESVDFVHTNQLLHMLKDPDSDTRPWSQQVRLLLSEASRVLTPGGQLLMREVVPEHLLEFEPGEEMKPMTEMGDLVHRLLKQFGFGKIAIEQATGRRDADYIYDPNRSFDNYLEFNVAQTLAIYARKQPSTVYEMPR